MSMIVVNRVNDQITGFVNGNPYSVLFSEEKYAAMKQVADKAASATDMAELTTLVEEFEALTKENYKQIVEHAQGGKYLWVNPHTGKMYLAFNGFVSSKAVPRSLADRIITSVEKKIDINPLVKCWARFLKNPHYTDQKAINFAKYINTTVVNDKLRDKLMSDEGLSHETASKKATMYDISFTQEGLLATYKVVREIDWKFVASDEEGGVKKVDRFEYEVDEFTGLKTYKKPEFLEKRVFEPAVQGQRGDEFNSGEYSGHIIRVGMPVYLDSWDKVNCNDTQSCVKGLHVGGLRYIKNYQSDDTITLNVFVDPMHIGGIDHEGTGALRVLKFFPHSALEIKNQNLYHSSEYAKITDAEYQKLVEEAVAAHNKKTAEDLLPIQEMQKLAQNDSQEKLFVED